MAGDDYLSMAGDCCQAVTEHARGSGMQGDFGFFNANEGNFFASTAIGRLYEGRQNSKAELAECVRAGFQMPSGACDTQKFTRAFVLQS